MKQLLLIADAFPPDFAPRMGYLCRCLESFHDQEWQVTVIAPDEGGDMYDIPFQRTEIHRIALQPSPGPLRHLRWTLSFLGTLFFNLKDRKFRRHINAICRDRHFDLVLCSSYYTFPLNSAADMARRRRIPFVADLRDIAEEYTENDFFQHPLPRLLGLEQFVARFYRHVSIRRRNRALRHVDALTSVSPWHVRTIAPLLQKSALTRVIFNGFDQQQFTPVLTTTDKFIITYTGRLYNSSIRDPQLLFSALRTLIDTIPSFADDTELHWYTDDRSWQEVSRFARLSRTESLSQRCQAVPVSRMPDILNRSSVVLVISNRTPDNGPKGILTTKFFEAMGCERPVLCVRSDEDLLEETVQSARIGCAARTQDDAVQFLREKYLQWKSERHTSQTVNRQVRDRFSRQYQARQFLDLFHSLTELTERQ